MKVWKIWEFNACKDELEESLNDMQKDGKKIEYVSSCIVSDFGRCYKGVVIYTEEDTDE